MSELQKIPLFTQHSRSWRENRYVYPVLSRRSKGLSIGVNLNPDKVCNFDCLYCCVDRTVPPEVKDVDLGLLRAELDHLLGLSKSGEIFAHSPFDQSPSQQAIVSERGGSRFSPIHFEDMFRLVGQIHQVGST